MSKETNGITPVQFYFVQSVNSGLYLQPNGNESGAQLYQIFPSANPNQPGDAEQMWAFIEFQPGSGIYRIFNAYSGCAIDVKGDKDNPPNGAVVQQYEWRPGQLNQLWIYNPQTKWLQTRLPSEKVMVLDVKDASKEAAPVQLHEYNMGANQQWELIPVPLSSTK